MRAHDLSPELRKKLRSMSEEELCELRKELIDKNDNHPLLSTDTPAGYDLTYDNNEKCEFTLTRNNAIKHAEALIKDGYHVDVIEKRVIFTTNDTRTRVRGRVISYDHARAVAEVELEDGTVVSLHSIAFSGTGKHPAPGNEIIGTLKREGDGIWKYVDARPYRDDLDKFRKLLSYVEYEWTRINKEANALEPTDEEYKHKKGQSVAYYDVLSRLKELL